ncbi:hypothetical protein A0H81_01992 [Grifola frondosa]|uniref:Uncharacterized protein n=1 Tax=Grifola frondosa TaxID=5627 RepID=A0A1C7MLG9_GRIFR|nr:hypothetical protein A0H81_01992 [Grifola frondosa]
MSSEHQENAEDIAAQTQSKDLYFRCAATEMQIREWRIWHAIKAFPPDADEDNYLRWCQGLENELVHIKDLIGKMFLTGYQPFIPRLVSVLIHHSLHWERGRYFVGMGALSMPTGNPRQFLRHLNPSPNAMPGGPGSKSHTRLRQFGGRIPKFATYVLPFDDTLGVLTFLQRDTTRIMRADWEELSERVFELEEEIRNHYERQQSQIAGLEVKIRSAEETILSKYNANYDPTGFDRAISAIWPAYRPGTGWRQLQHPNERWLTSQTAESVVQRSQIVHYDLLGGELLINGKPLGRLPSNILANPLYSLVFGSKVLDIVPGSMPGTEYATRGEIDGYQVNIGTCDLSYQRRDDPRSCSSRNFLGDLPHSFVHDHIHWLDIRTGAVELRPTIDKWNSLSKNWHIHFSLNGHSFMRREDATLVDIRSRTYEMLAKRLEPLESKDRIIISCRGEQPGTTLSVDMPRFGLSFFVDKNNELQSRNMRNMVVDSDQSTGTMIGLRNQLVLPLLIPSR